MEYITARWLYYILVGILSLGFGLYTCYKDGASLQLWMNFYEESSTIKIRLPRRQGLWALGTVAVCQIMLFLEETLVGFLFALMTIIAIVVLSLSLEIREQRDKRTQRELGQF